MCCVSARVASLVGGEEVEKSRFDRLLVPWIWALRSIQTVKPSGLLLYPNSCIFKVSKIESAFAPPSWALAAGMMHSSNGNSSDRYLPMDYGMHHAPHHPQAPPSHHPHPSHDPHLHYALPPSHHTPLGAAPPPSAHHGMKRSPESAGLDMMSPSGGGSSDDEGSMHDVKPSLGSERGSAGRGTSLKGGNEGPPAGKKTKGRVKIKMEFIDNKLRRYTTFSKRKTGIMKKVKTDRAFISLEISQVLNCSMLARFLHMETCLICDFLCTFYWLSFLSKLHIWLKSKLLAYILT